MCGLFDPPFFSFSSQVQELSRCESVPSLPTPPEDAPEEAPKVVEGNVKDPPGPPGPPARNGSGHPTPPFPRTPD